MAAIAIPLFTATTETTANQLSYHFTFRLSETSGRSGVKVNAITLTLQPGFDVLPLDWGYIPAGTNVDSPTLSYSYPGNHPVAQEASLRVEFTDDGGRPGVATKVVAITQAQRFAVSGQVTDSVSGVPPSDAALFVNDSFIRTDSTGHYSVRGILSGNVTIGVAATGYEDAARSINLLADAVVDIRLDPFVEFVVSGTANHVVTSLHVGTQGFSNLGGAPRLTYVFPGTPIRGVALEVSAEIDDPRDRGTVTVALYKQGKLVQTVTATGFPNAAAIHDSY